MRRRLRRIAVMSGAMVLGPPLLAASCTESFPRGAGDASVPVTATPAWCASSPGPERCTGSDPTYVFSPPLSCEDAGMDAEGDASAADAAEGDASAADAAVVTVDPCALVTTFSVFFTPAACQALATAEVGGALASDLDPAAPTLDEPMDGDQLTPDQWQIFSWRKAPSRDARGGTIRRAAEFLEPSARAFSPLTGTAYVLEFAQGCNEILRVMVTGSIWVPDAVSWNTLSAIDGPVSVRVVEVHFSGDAMVGAPQPSLPITITMSGGDAGAGEGGD